MHDLTQGVSNTPLRVAVIGSGPSGFYAIQALFKTANLNVQADLLDRMPTPFGLVRSGVAPDHQKIKNVVRVYDKIASDTRFRFFGNVELGRDLHMEDLRARYDAIILATGNESDRRLGIPGEDLAGVHSATEFVGWYNAHPDFQSRSFNLQDARRVVIIGNGNVAVDVARVIGRTSASLSETDITERSLLALEKSGVQEVVMVARRGPAQAAFSPKELKELAHADGCFLKVNADEVPLDSHSQAWLDEHGTKDARKNLDLLRAATDQVVPQGDIRTIHCRFLASPIEFLGEEDQLAGIVFERNEIYVDERGNLRPRGTGETFQVKAEIAFKAIGYRGTPIPGVPFHDAWGIVPNADGRVLDEPNGRPVTGLYVAGWAKRGPTGLIGTNSRDAQLTVALLLMDLESGAISPETDRKSDDLPDFLTARGVTYASREDWQRLDAEERRLGEAKGKIREKFTTIEAMMKAMETLRP